MYPEGLIGKSYLSVVLMGLMNLRCVTPLTIVPRKIRESDNDAFEVINNLPLKLIMLFTPPN